MEKKKKMLIGGQAVIEGVMMKSQNFYSVAIRRANGEIKTKTERYNSFAKKIKVHNKMFLRGIVVLIETIILGMKTLSYSADEYALDFEDEKEKQKKQKTQDNKLSTEIIFALIFSFLFGIVLFVLGPLFLARIIKSKWIVTDSHFVFNMVDGIIRLIVFLLYVSIISLMKDIRRVFAYHGAEHKAVFAYEFDDALDVNGALKHKTLHPRCGTNFLLIVMILSILIFSMFKVDTFLLKFLLRIIFMPVIAGISYEVIRFLGKYSKSKIAKIFLFPGLMLQKLTTRVPDEGQLEVAVVAINEVLRKEEEHNGYNG